MRNLLVFFSCLFCLVVPLPAQHEHPTASPGQAMQDPSSEPEEIGWVPREILNRPVLLHEGLGPVHEKVTTSSLEAQKFYDQGLAYLHSYVWIEAARSFRQALRSDPHLGMAYVGLADAYIGLQNVGSARAACESARKLEAYMNSGERAWLTIRDREVAYLESGNDGEKYAAYRLAIDEAIKASPRDPWLLVQRGLAT